MNNNNDILDLIYKFLLKAIIAERSQTKDGYINEAMEIIETEIKRRDY